jgi:hypothetical protein
MKLIYKKGEKVPKPTMMHRIMAMFFAIFLVGLGTWAENVRGVRGTLELIWGAFLDGQLTW